MTGMSGADGPPGGPPGRAGSGGGGEGAIAPSVPHADMAIHSPVRMRRCAIRPGCTMPPWAPPGSPGGDRPLKFPTSRAGGAECASADLHCNLARHSRRSSAFDAAAAQAVEVVILKVDPRLSRLERQTASRTKLLSRNPTRHTPSFRPIVRSHRKPLQDSARAGRHWLAAAHDVSHSHM